MADWWAEHSAVRWAAQTVDRMANLWAAKKGRWLVETRAVKKGAQMAAHSVASLVSQMAD